MPLLFSLGSQGEKDIQFMHLATEQSYSNSSVDMGA